MPSIDTALLFVAASTVLALAPGPDNLFVLSQAALHGRRAGLVITLGLCTGLIAHTAAVVLGIAVVVATSPIAFTLLKLFGVSYLLYLAWEAVRAEGDDAAAEAPERRSFPHYYLRGIVMNVSNPKVAIFFLAYLPQFAAGPAASWPLQLAILGALFILVTLVVFGGIAVFAGTFGRWLASSARARMVLQRVAGTVFLGLAFRLALAER